MKCTRNDTCRCDDCAAAFSMFSGKELLSITSTVFVDEDDVEEKEKNPEGSVANEELVTSENAQIKVAVPPKPVIVPDESVNTVEAKPDAAEPLSIDSQPISPPGATDSNVEESFEGIDMMSLLCHSNWKARKLGFEKLKRELEVSISDRKTDYGADFTDLFEKCVSENSVGGLDLALSCAALLARENYLCNDNGELTKASLKKLFKKALIGRPSTKEIAISLVMDLVQAGCESMKAMFGACKEACADKNIKVQQSSLVLVKKAIGEFGIPPCPVQTLRDIVVLGLQQRAVPVRKESTEVAVIADEWLNGQFASLLFDVLEDNKRTPIENALKKASTGSADGRIPKEPPRKIKGMENELRQNSSQQGFDAFETLKERSILPRLESEINFSKMLQSPKWSERKQALNAVTNLCGDPPKLEKGDYSDLVRSVRTVVQQDTNPTVVVAALNLLRALSAGLRQRFRQHSYVIAPPLLNKYREKKTLVVNAIDEVLDECSKYCFSVTDDPVLSAVASNISLTGESNKPKSTPLQRCQVFRWLLRCLDTDKCWKKEKFNVAGFCKLLDIVIKGCEDADQKVRVTATSCLSKFSSLSSCIGFELDPECTAYVAGESEKLIKRNPMLKDKIGWSSKSKPVQSDSKDETPIVSEVAESDARETVKKVARNTGLTSGKPLSTSAKQQAAHTTEMPASTPSVSHVENVSDTGTKQQINDFMDDCEVKKVICNLEIEGLADALTLYETNEKWQDRMPVFSTLEAYLSESNTIDVNTACAIVLFVRFLTKGFKETNFNIMNAGWKVVKTAVEKVDACMPKKFSLVILDSACLKIGDKKQGIEIGNLILALCECFGPKEIIEIILDRSNKMTVPKLLEETCRTFNNIVKEFGASCASPNLTNLVGFASGPRCLGSRVQPCKAASTDLLVELHLQLGPAIVAALSDEAKTALSPKFEKAGFVGVNVDPKRKAKFEDENDREAIPQNLPVAEDLTTRLTSKLFSQLDDTSTKISWKTRKQALTEISEMIRSCRYGIVMNRATRELTDELRKRLIDSNGHLVLQAIDCISALGKAIGPQGVMVMSKTVMKPILHCFGDTKKQILQAAEKLVRSWTEHNGRIHAGSFFSILSQCEKPLGDPKIDRKIVLRWFIDSFKPSDEDFSSYSASHGAEVREVLLHLVSPLIFCLQSNNPEERKLAVKSVSLVIGYIGQQEGATLFRMGCRDLKPAVSRSVRPLIDQALSESTTGSVSRVPASNSVVFDVKKSNLNEIKPTASVTSTVTTRHTQQQTSSSPKRADHTSRVEAAFPSVEKAFKAVPSSLRAQREHRGLRTRWPAAFDEKDKMHIAEVTNMLRDDLDKVVGKDLLELMFRNYDSGRFARGAALDPAFQVLTSSIPSQAREALEAFDLLLKWSTLQLLSNNSAATVHILDLLTIMFELAKNSAYSMTDYELSLFLPHLIRRLADKQTRFRESIRSIMNLVSQVCPMSKYVVFIFGECSANQRSIYILVECIDEMARLVQEKGVAITKTKVGVGHNILRTIVALVGDSRKDVRNASLTFIEALWVCLNRDSVEVLRLITQNKAMPNDKVKVIIENFLLAAAQKPQKTEMKQSGEFPRKNKEEANCRTLNLQMPNPNRDHPSDVGGAPGDNHTQAYEKPKMSQFAPMTPEKTRRIVEDDSSAMGSATLRNVSATKSYEVGISTFADFSIPSTPPSPTERKRLSSIKKSSSLLEKENRPASATAGVHIDVFPAGDELLNLSPKKSADEPKVYARNWTNVSALLGDLLEYERFLRYDESGPNHVSQKGNEALALLGGGCSCESQEFELKAMADSFPKDLDFPRVLSVLLDILAQVTDSTGEGDICTIEMDSGVLHLLLPGLYLMSWSSRLRQSLRNHEALMVRLISSLCILVSWLEERIDNVPGPRKKLACEYFSKLAKKVLSKLTTLHVWLPTVLARIQSVHLNSALARARAQEDDAYREVRQKAFLSSQILNFVSLQNSMANPYASVDMDETILKLHSLLECLQNSCESDSIKVRRTLDHLVHSMVNVSSSGFMYKLTSAEHSIASGPLKAMMQKFLASNEKPPPVNFSEDLIVHLNKGDAKGSTLNEEVRMILASISESFKKADTQKSTNEMQKLREFVGENPGFDVASILEKSEIGPELRKSIHSLVDAEINPKGTSRYALMRDRLHKKKTIMAQNNNIAASVGIGSGVVDSSRAAAPTFTAAIDSGNRKVDSPEPRASKTSLSIQGLRERMQQRKARLGAVQRQV